MAAMNASMAVLAAPQVAVADRLASRSSVSFNNGGLRTMTFVRARVAGPLSARASFSQDTNRPGNKKPDIESSTGHITDKAREVAEKTGAVFDGVKEKAEDLLTDSGRELKSKTEDVVSYGSNRNADGIGSDVVQKTNEAQTKYTKGK